MSTSGVWNPTIDMGADWKRILAIKDAAGSPIAYGSPAYMDIRDGDKPTSPLVARFDSSGGGDGTITFNAGLGTITLTMSDEETRVLRPGRFSYDLFATDTGGLSARLVYGAVTIHQNTSTP
jgi:hypothetical protein